MRKVIQKQQVLKNKENNNLVINIILIKQFNININIKSKEKGGNMMKKNQKGITLIALVITIIVLLILAGVSIAMISGQDGILGKAKTAADKTTIETDREQANLAVQSALAQYYEEKYAEKSDDTANGFLHWITLKSNHEYLQPTGSDTYYTVTGWASDDTLTSEGTVEITVALKHGSETGKVTDSGTIDWNAE